jgi:hypothetical protein
MPKVVRRKRSRKVAIRKKVVRKRPVLQQTFVKPEQEGILWRLLLKQANSFTETQHLY